MENILNGNLDSFQNPQNRGWFAGSFVDPSSPFHTSDFEVKWSTHSLGDKKNIPQKSDSKTITLLIEGNFKVIFPDTNQEFLLKKVGDYVYFVEGVLHSWESLQDKSRMLTIRWPSISK